MPRRDRAPKHMFARVAKVAGTVVEVKQYPMCQLKYFLLFKAGVMRGVVGCGSIAHLSPWISV